MNSSTRSAVRGKRGGPSRGGNNSRGSSAGRGAGAGRGNSAGGSVSGGNLQQPIASHGQAIGGSIQNSVAGMAVNSTSDSGTLCGLCNIEVSTDAIGCDKCPLWFHPTSQCTGLQAETIAVIKSSDGDSIDFKCSSCRCKNTSLLNQSNTSNNQIIDPLAITQVFEMVKALTVTVATLANQISVLVNNNNQTTPNNVNYNNPGNFQGDLYAELWEFEERRKRCESLIVRGSGANSNAEFSQFFAGLSEVLVGSNVVPDEVVCINTENSLYRIKINNGPLRSRFLQRARNLRNHDEYRNVYINKDLTFKQREELRHRRELSRENNEVRNVNSLQDNQLPASQSSLPNQPSRRLNDGQVAATSVAAPGQFF